MTKIRYCALTTLAGSLRSFVLPSAINLVKNGYEVTLVSQGDRNFEEELPNEISFFPLDIQRGVHLCNMLRCIKSLYLLFRKERFQMVEYGTENVSFCASIAAFFAGVPIRIYNHWGARYVGYSGFMRQLSLFIERTAALFSTDIRQQSPKNMEICINDKVYPASKVKVLGYGGTVGADFNRFDKEKKQEWNTLFRNRYSIPNDAFVFGDVGYIRVDKGSGELIEAFKNLNNPTTWLVLVGPRMEEDDIAKGALEWATSCNRVIFTGRVSDVPQIIAAFDCIVHPSYREGLGMVLQEAGAMGIPYIACNIPGPGEIGIEGETGLLVNKADSLDLQEKMAILANDREKAKKMGEKMFSLTKERYERSVMLKRILDDRNELSKKIK